MRRAAGGDPVGLGETIADASGRWGLTVGPLSGTFLLYGVAIPVGGSPIPITLLNEGRPIAVDPHPVRLLSASGGPGAGRVTLKYARTAPEAPDPAGLLAPSSYGLVLADGRRLAPVSVRPTGGRGPRAVTLNFAPRSLPRRGDAILVATLPGVQAPDGSTPEAVQLALSFGRRRP